MQWLIVPAIFFAFGAICFPLGLVARRTQRKFERECRPVHGEIVYYSYHNDDSIPTPHVSFLDSEEKEPVTTHLNCRKVTEREFPVGTKVSLNYTRKKVLGNYAYDIRLCDELYQPISLYTIFKILTTITAIFWTLAAILFIIGLKQN